MKSPVVASLVLLALFTLGCEEAETAEYAQAREAARVYGLQVETDQIISSLRYIKDPRTGLCFASSWRGGVHGGPGLAMVPCEAIPPQLLTVATVATSNK